MKKISIKFSSIKCSLIENKFKIDILHDCHSVSDVFTIYSQSNQSWALHDYERNVWIDKTFVYNKIGIGLADKAILFAQVFFLCISIY